MEEGTGEYPGRKGAGGEEKAIFGTSKETKVEVV